jgi:hypothetical protein
VEFIMRLLDLPSNLTVSILSTWIEVHDLAKLDSAFCNYISRPVLLTTLQSPELVLRETGSTDGYENLSGWMKWHTLRSVKAEINKLAGGTDEAALDIVGGFIGTVGGSKLSTAVFCDMSKTDSPICHMMLVNCRTLKNLCAEECEELNGLESLIQSCSSSLNSLTVENTAIDIFNFNNLKLPSMRMLKLVDSCNSEDVRKLLQCCNQLSEVVISNDADVTDSCLDALEAHAESLTRLELRSSFAAGVSNAALTRLGVHCVNLRKLFLTVFEDSDRVVEAFVKAAGRLDTLGVNAHITDQLLTLVATHCGPRLRHLYVDGSGALYSEVGLAALTKHCTLLQSLRYLTGTLEAGAERCTGYVNLISAQTGLLSIDFTNLAIADSLLEALADRCPQLQEIVLSSAVLYTAAGLLRLINGCKKLRRVQLTEDDSDIPELVRLLWAQITPAVKFDYSAEPQRCWQYKPY